MPPTLLCSTGPFYMLPIRQTLEAIAAAGFTQAEIMVTGEREAQDPVELRAICEQNGVRPAAIHAPFLLALARVFSVNPLEKIRRSTALAQEIGAPLVVAHPPFQWQRGYTRWLKSELEEFVTAEETTIAIENMFAVGRRGLAVPFYSAISIEHMKRYPFVVLDTSHCGVSGVDVLSAARELQDRIVHIHLSNNLGTGSDSHAPLTQGVLPIGSLLGQLSADGYSGTITLELDVRPHASSPARLVSFLREQREYCLERLLAAPAGT